MAIQQFRQQLASKLRHALSLLVPEGARRHDSGGVCRNVAPRRPIIPKKFVDGAIWAGFFRHPHLATASPERPGPLPEGEGAKRRRRIENPAVRGEPRGKRREAKRGESYFFDPVWVVTAVGVTVGDLEGLTI